MNSISIEKNPTWPRGENSAGHSPVELGVFPVPRQNAWWENSHPEKALLQGRRYLLAKRALDLLILFSALPFLIPVMIFCAICIKLESPQGPVFFKQERTGKGGRRFLLYKFRTMVPNAEAMKQELIHLNELQWPDFKITHDPRVTRVGRWLRKTSLDELPQVINILTGEMTLVGPRPTSFSPKTYQLWQTERLDVLPGLTGLWQVVGRGSMEFDERVRLDVAYIERRCLSLDVKILFRTLSVVLHQRGAY